MQKAVIHIKFIIVDSFSELLRKIVENFVELWKKSAKLWITFSNFYILKKLSAAKDRVIPKLLTTILAGQAYNMRHFFAICLQKE